MDIYTQWPAINIPRKTVFKLLKWPWINRMAEAWPPHQYAWSSMNERSVLLWLSNQFETPSELATWVTKHAENTLTQQHIDFIQWLYSKADNATVVQAQYSAHMSESVMPFIYTCVERSLLWDDPGPTRPSDMIKGIQMAQKLFAQWRGNVQISEIQKNEALSLLNDTRWSVYHSQAETRIIQTVYDALSFSCRLDSLESDELLHLLCDSKVALINAIEHMWLWRNRDDWTYANDHQRNQSDYLSKEYLIEQKLFHAIVAKEEQWFALNCPLNID